MATWERGKEICLSERKKPKRLNVCVFVCVCTDVRGVFVGMEEGHNKQMLRAGWSQKGHWPVSPTELHKWC